MNTETDHTESGSSPPRKRPDLSLYFPGIKPRRTKPLGTKFTVRQPEKTQDDLRRLRDTLAETSSKPTTKPRRGARVEETTS